MYESRHFILICKGNVRGIISRAEKKGLYWLNIKCAEYMVEKCSCNSPNILEIYNLEKVSESPLTSLSPTLRRLGSLL